MDTTKLRNEIFQMIEEQILHDYMRFGQVSYQRAKELTEQTAIMQKIRAIEKLEKPISKLKIGDFAKIVNASNGHRFKYGSIVTVEGLNDETPGLYFVSDGVESYWVTDLEVEKI